VIPAQAEIHFSTFRFYSSGASLSCKAIHIVRGTMDSGFRLDNQQRGGAMGMLVEGTWFDDDPPPDRAGRFVRSGSLFRDRVTRDGASG
jgi:hypothetical protein